MLNYDRRYDLRKSEGRYIPEDVQAVRRRKILQEQQLQEELRQKRLKKREQERLQRRKKKLEQIVRVVVFTSMIYLAFMLGRISGYKKYEKEQDMLTFMDMSNQMNQAKERQERVEQVDTVPFMRTYEARYAESKPQMYSKEEISNIIHELAQTDSDFAKIETQFEQYPEELLNVLCNNPNMVSYALSYKEKYGMIYGDLEDCELEGVPLFIQWDSRWGYFPYGNNVIGLSGCGPTCMSMVVVGLTKNQNATPVALAEYATEHGYYEAGAGTKWTFMEDAGSAYGVETSWLPLQKETLYSELEQGHPVICAMREGDFTAQGHFVVITGIEDGKLRIHDPNSVIRSNKLWDYEDIEDQIANLWSYKLAEG
ncbi:MAG: C39 family peptidase [Wujia sp.]